MYGIYAYNNKLWGAVQNMGIYYLNFTNSTYTGPTQPVNYSGQSLGGSTNTTTQISWSY
jgi:methyl coenzyme M reductase gamma subunit